MTGNKYIQLQYLWLATNNYFGHEVVLGAVAIKMASYQYRDPHVKDKTVL